MSHGPSYSRHRRSPIQVEPLEGRTLLSAVKARTPQGQTQLVITPSSQYVSQEQGSFTVNLNLTKVYENQATAALGEPLTVDFSASMGPSGGGTPEAASSFFTPYHETVTFPAGALVETVTVPVRSSETVTAPTALSLSATPTSEAQGVAPNSLTVPLYSGPDAYPPTITDVRLVTQGKVASAVVLGFSKPMAQTTVENVHSYRILSRPKTSSKRGFLFWGGSTTTEFQSFPIAAAKYDPSASTVTLTLKRPVRASSLYQVSSAYPLQGHELTDAKGQAVATPGPYGFWMENGFTKPIHPTSGATPSLVGPLRTTYKSDSPASNFFNPMKGFK